MRTIHARFEAPPVGSPLRAALLFAATLALLGCEGAIIGERPEAPKPNPTIEVTGGGTYTSPFQCNAANENTVTPLRRLSVAQYRNSLRELFTPAPGFDALTVGASGLSKLPIDDDALPFASLDVRFSEDHLTAWYEISDALATAVTNDTSALTALAGNCATQTTANTACIDGFLDRFALRVFRRPLTTEERARYHALNDGSRDGKELFRSLFFSLLMAPQFLYHAEVNGQALDAEEKNLALDGYELASRLSFHFWQSMPDDALLTAARDGSLLTEDGYRAQVERVMADPRTRATISSFYAEWFHIGRVTRFPTSAAFTSFASGTTIGQSGADHLAAADAEIDALTQYFTWDHPGTVKDLFTTNLSFTRSPHLASLYGVQPWNGTGLPPSLPAGERAGLLTRVAFLVSGNQNTHPIHRGAAVRRRVLCDELQSPPALPPDALTPPAPHPGLTTRQRFENKIANQPCAGCHAQINPIGYVLEQYDAIGRFRTQEKVLDETSGALLNTLPIDSSAVAAVLADDPSLISTGAELSEKVAVSGKVEACFARQYFRFTTRRMESVADGCVLERMRTTAGGDLQSALKQMALDPTFRTRKVTP